MYDGLQLQNYLPGMTGQLGLPFVEDLRIQKQMDADCCSGQASNFDEEKPAECPKPLKAAAVPTMAEGRPKQGERPREVRPREDDAASLP